MLIAKLNRYHKIRTKSLDFFGEKSLATVKRERKNRLKKTWLYSTKSLYLTKVLNSTKSLQQKKSTRHNKLARTTNHTDKENQKAAQ